MAIFRQISTLVRKTLLITVVRHPIAYALRAIIIPLVIALIIAFAGKFFNSNQIFGVGPSFPIQSLSDALGSSSSRSVVGFVDNGLKGGNISSVIDSLSSIVASAGKTVKYFDNNSELGEFCKGGGNGESICFAGVIFGSSPTEPRDGGIWNYTIRTDSSLSNHPINVDSPTNADAQEYILPLQKEIDHQIVLRSTALKDDAIPAAMNNFIYTSQTEQEREDAQKDDYLSAFASAFGGLVFFALMDIFYHLPGFVASERELGMSQLMDAMVPGTSSLKNQAIRLFSTYLAFSIMYFPVWIAVGITLSTKVFAFTSAAIVIIYHLLVGLACCSFALFGAVLFKKAQLSGALILVFAIALLMVANFLSDRLVKNGAVTGLSLFFPFANYGFFLPAIAQSELNKAGMSLIKVVPGSRVEILPIWLWVFLILQALLYPIAALFLEKALWGTTSRGRKARPATSAFESPLQLSEFSKTYRQTWAERILLFQKKKPQVHAVKSLTLEAPKGQISMLLGPNGSGKSTTLDAIAGLCPVTDGTIIVDSTGGIGIAPQKNVLWDDLTVEEHIEIFANLKCIGSIDTKVEVERLILGCDLSNKRKSRAKTLSGGQKRKLQLAMMFAGGSAVCCVDEVSSGLDPLSRRKIWDILLAERGNRTIIMTTHFLDEADFLADDIAILAKGVLKAQGSSAELKHRLGNGYSIHITDTSDITLPTDVDVLEVSNEQNRTTYRVATSAHAAKLIAKLEADRIYNYHVSGPTIEELFLKMTEDPIVDSSSGNSQSDATRQGSTEKEDSPSNAIMSENNTLDLKDGRKISPWKQGWILWKKRLTILRRSYMPYLTAVVLALIGAGVSPALLETFKPLGCPQDNNAVYNGMDTYTYRPQAFYWSKYAKIPIGPRSKVSNDTIQLLINTFNESTAYYDDTAPTYDDYFNTFIFLDTVEEFRAYFDANHSSFDVQAGGVFLSDPPVFAWNAYSYDFAAPMYLQNFADIILTGLPILTSQSDLGDFNLGELFDFNSLIFVVIFGLVFSAYPAFFALYPTNERLRKMRAMQYSNGVRSVPLWTAYLIFDAGFILIISVIATVLLAVGWAAWYSLPMIFVVLFLYGISSALLGYILSMFAPSSLAAWMFSACGQLVMYFAYFGALLGIQAHASFATLEANLNKLQFGLSLISPIDNVLRSLLIGLGLFATTCGDISYSASITLYGGPILYLILQSIFMFALLIWWDSGFHSPLAFLRRSPTPHDSEATISSAADEITREVVRTQSLTSGLRVSNLTKTFKSNRAVDDISFGIAPGEIFGLLGPNGAGKTTAISLIRGDLSPTATSPSARISIDAASVLTQRATARSLLGVCPQFDCADNMSVRANLHFFAQIRGVPSPAHNVAAVIAATGLTAHAHKLTSQLSGGTRRKLSLAIALVGNPRALLLDEPSSGLDAAAKRAMWRALADVARGRAVLLTTHSMEEADALAQRVGIMSGRMLALGSVGEMRARGGDVYHVHAVLRSAPRSGEEETRRVKEWVREHVPAVTVERETYGGQVRFNVARARGDVSIGELFALMERAKEGLGVGFYSVGRTTLDEVFVGVVREHGGREEGVVDDLRKDANRGHKIAGRKGWFGGKK